jgi:hypothetical protein
VFTPPAAHQVRVDDGPRPLELFGSGPRLLHAWPAGWLAGGDSCPVIPLAVIPALETRALVLR